MRRGAAKLGKVGRAFFSTLLDEQGTAPVQFVDLIRHGEPDGGSRYRGQLDDPLSERGWAQMRAALLDQPDYRVVISSPMRRCEEFARVYAAQRALPLEVEPDLREIAMGAWEGLTRSEARDRDPEAFQNFYFEPTRYRPEGAEDIGTFQARISRVWNRVTTRYPEGGVLVVAHAGTLRAIVAHILALPPDSFYRCHMDHGARIRILLRADGPNQVCFPGPD